MCKPQTDMNIFALYWGCCSVSSFLLFFVFVPVIILSFFLVLLIPFH